MGNFYSIVNLKELHNFQYHLKLFSMGNIRKSLSRPCGTKRALLARPVLCKINFCLDFLRSSSPFHSLIIAPTEAELWEMGVIRPFVISFINFRPSLFSSLLYYVLPKSK